MQINLKEVKQKTFSPSKVRSRIQKEKDESCDDSDLEEEQSNRKEDRRDNNLSFIKMKIPPFKRDKMMLKLIWS